MVELQGPRFQKDTGFRARQGSSCPHPSCVLLPTLGPRARGHASPPPGSAFICVPIPPCFPSPFHVAFMGHLLCAQPALLQVPGCKENELEGRAGSEVSWMSWWQAQASSKQLAASSSVRIIIGSGGQRREKAAIPKGLHPPRMKLQRHQLPHLPRPCSDCSLRQLRKMPCLPTGLCNSAAWCCV